MRMRLTAQTEYAIEILGPIHQCKGTENDLPGRETLWNATLVRLDRWHYNEDLLRNRFKRANMLGCLGCGFPFEMMPIQKNSTRKTCQMFGTRSPLNREASNEPVCASTTRLDVPKDDLSLLENIKMDGFEQAQPGT